MKNMIKMRNNIIVILCVTIIFLGIGFILLSAKLNHINNTDNTFHVVFENLKLVNSVKGSTIEPKSNAYIEDNKEELFMSYSLNSVHDEITYTVNIKNKGNIPAEIVDIIESPNYRIKPYNNAISPVSIYITDVKGKVIEPDESIDLKVTVYYNPSSNQPTSKNFSFKLGIIAKSS